jgi:hypothetical protein
MKLKNLFRDDRHSNIKFVTEENKKFQIGNMRLYGTIGSKIIRYKMIVFNEINKRVYRFI